MIKKRIVINATAIPPALSAIYFRLINVLIKINVFRILLRGVERVHRTRPTATASGEPLEPSRFGPTVRLARHGRRMSR